MTRRLITGGLVALCALFAFATQATAQQNTGTLIVRAVDSSGQLVDSSRAVCWTVLVAGEGGGAFTPGPSQTPMVQRSFELPTGPVWVGASTCSDAEQTYAPVWSWGAPLGSFDFGLHPASGVVTEGGQTTVTVAVGQGFITGSIGGASQADCDVRAHPTGSDWPVPTEGTISDGTYSIRVAPGSYRVSSKCRLASSPRWGSDNSRFGDTATVITVTHGQAVSGVDMAPPVGGNSSVAFMRLNDLSLETPYCVDFTTPSGRLVDRSFRDNSTPEFGHTTRLAHGDYRIRVWDCTFQGFDTIWYPNSPTRVGGHTVSLTPGQFDTELPSIVQIVVDPDLVCGGRPATIVGTAGNDRLTGTPEADVIMGLGGNDNIRAGNGRDIICGGDGRDRLFGGRQADHIFGGSKGDLIRGDAGSDNLVGEGGRDRIIGANGDDRLRGGGSALDTLDGRGGNDFCHDSSPFTRFLDCETESP